MGSHKAARKISKAKVICLAPDVCKTLGGTPVPYNATAKLHLSTNVSPNVRFTGCYAFTIDSNTLKTWGDEPGLGKGLKSQTVGEKSEPISKSNTVRINGKWLVRHDDTFHMNNKNTVGKLVYPTGGGAASVSDAGFSLPSCMSGASDSFTQGVIDKVAQIGKKVAMDVVMGKDPMDSLKQMVNPKNLIQGQIAGMLGPVGGMIGSQLLNQVFPENRRGKSPSRARPKGVRSNPFASPETTNNILRQSGLSPQKYIEHLSDEEKDALYKRIMKADVAKAFADGQLEILGATGKTSDLKGAHQTLFNAADTCVKLSKRKQLASKTDWQAMLNQEDNHI